jgi:hypothetical protein
VRPVGILLISGFICAAQIPPQKAAFLRGILVQRDALADRGEFSVRAAGNQVVRYRFDGKTYVEREERSIDVPRLRPGEEVEVLSDLLGNSPTRYARTIHVIDPAPPPRRRPRPRSGITDPPRGDLTFSGVVLHLIDGQLALRTYDAGEQRILIRQDTRYVAEGQTVAVSDLKTNTRVFVRAGKDESGRVEAYLVAWGGILLPH